MSDKFSAPEPARGGKLDINQIHAKELDILVWFKGLCEDNGWKYFVTSGTLLGAVRHKGFIPWDDDADVLMPRADYEKFLTLFRSGGNGSKYRLHAYDLSGKAASLVTKLYDSCTAAYDLRSNKKVANLGVHIDIFALDGMGETEEQAAALIKKIRVPLKYKMWLLAGKCYCPKKRIYLWPVKYAGYLYAKALGLKRIQKKIDKLSKLYDYKKSNFLGCVTSFGDKREIMPAYLYRDSVNVEFEGESFEACANPHEYLTRFYGDYMTLPEEENRVSIHDFDYYLEEKKC